MSLSCAAHRCTDSVVRNVRTKRGPMYACATHERMLRDAGELLDRLEAAPVGRASLLEDAPVRAPRPRLVLVEPIPVPSEPPMPSAPSPSSPASPVALPSVGGGGGASLAGRRSAHPALIVDADAPANRCRIVGCAKRVEARGLCTAGYNLWLRLGKPEGIALDPISRKERGFMGAQALGHRTPAAEAPVREAPPVVAEVAADTAGPDPRDARIAELERKLAAVSAQRDEMEERVAAVNVALDEAGVDPDDECETEADAVRAALAARAAAPALTEAQLRAMVAELDAIAGEQRALDARRARVLGGVSA